MKSEVASSCRSLVLYSEAVNTEKEHQGALDSLLRRRWLAHLLELVALTSINSCIKDKPKDKDSVYFLSTMPTHRSDL